jgi:hypothetical protein
VTGGSKKPPKKRSNHKKNPKTIKFEIKGIGNPEKTAAIPIKHCKIYPLFVLYPPKYVVTIPPTITPKIGAVKLINK